MESKQFGVTRSYAPNHILGEAQCFHKVAGRTPLGTTTPNSYSHFLVTWCAAVNTTHTPVSHRDNWTRVTFLCTERNKETQVNFKL